MVLDGPQGSVRPRSTLIDIFSAFVICLTASKNKKKENGLFSGYQQHSIFILFLQYRISCLIYHISTVLLKILELPEQLK